MRANCQYYPFTFSLFYLENTLWGLNPTGYHLVNVLLHACDAVLVWLILRRIGVPGSWLAAMLFALHPVQVESVAWVTEQKNTLSCLLALSSLWFYLRFQPLDRDSQAEHPGVLKWKWYALSLVLFVLALLSKSAVGTLPGVILVLTWWKRPRLELSDLLPLVPFFLLGATLGLNTARLESDLVAVRRADFMRTPIDRLLISCRALWFYVYKLVLPLNLNFIYPRWHIDPRRFPAMDPGLHCTPGHRRSLPAAAPRGQGATCGGPLLLRNAFPRAWLCEHLFHEVLLCERPLSISCQHRPFCPVCRSCRPAISGHSMAITACSGIDYPGSVPAGFSDVFAVRSFPRCDDSLDRHSGKEPRRVAGTHESGHPAGRPRSFPRGSLASCEEHRAETRRPIHLRESGRRTSTFGRHPAGDHGIRAWPPVPDDRTVRQCQT